MESRGNIASSEARDAHRPACLQFRESVLPRSNNSSPVITADSTHLSREHTAAAADGGRGVLLRFRDLRKSFGGRNVLAGISGEIRQGEVILLRGENGSGKTTLLNILTGCLEPDAGSIHLTINSAQEHFHFPRKWWQNLNPWDHFTPERVGREGVGRTWQDIRLFPSLDLADNIAAASREAGDSAWTALFRPKMTRARATSTRRRSCERLASLGLSGRENSSADRISLGQSKRVAIGRALQAGARVLFLDEPLSGLDAAGVEEVIAMLRDVIREHEMAVLVIEHALNARHLEPLVNTAWELSDGKLFSLGSEENGRRSASTIRPFWRDEAFIANYRVTHQALERGASLTRLAPRISSGGSQEPVIRARGLVASRGGRVVLGHDGNGGTGGLSFDLAESEMAILEAPNGWGKSTLFELITGTGISADTGQIVFNNEVVSGEGSPSVAFYRNGGRALSSNTRLFPSLRLDELARLANAENPYLQQPQRTDELSGGQLRRAAIAATGRGRLTVYDELFHSLDSARIEELVSTLASDGSGRATLFLEPSSNA